MPASGASLAKRASSGHVKRSYDALFVPGLLTLHPIVSAAADNRRRRLPTT